MLAHRENIVLVDSNSKPSWGASYTVTVYEPGAVATGASSGTTITVNRAHGFQAGDKYLINPGTDDTFSGTDTVQSVTATTIVMGQSVSIAVGDVLVNLGADTGVAAPNYDASPISIHTRSDGSDTAISNSTVTCDAYGNYEYWARRYIVWELIRDSDGDPVSCMQGVTLQGRIDQFNLLDYGAVPNDASADNYTAIGLWIQDADNYNSSAAYPNAKLYAPAGEYYIATNDAFGNFTSAGASLATPRYTEGLVFQGDGQKNTIFRLAPAAADIYFYDRATGSDMKLVNPMFRDIGFCGGDEYSRTTGVGAAYSDVSEYAHGFAIYSESPERGFAFDNCEFSMLDTVFTMTGDNQSSENVFFNCNFFRIRSYVYKIDNLQSVNHTFFGCDFEMIWGHVFYIGSNGGGGVRVYGGSVIIQDSDIGTPADKWVLYGDGASSAITNGGFLFSDIRFELRDDNSGLVYAPNTTDGSFYVTFRGCSFIDDGGTVDKELVDTSGYNIITFRDCIFHNQSTATFTYTMRGYSNSYGRSGHLKWFNCHVATTLSEDITFTTATLGRATARGCYGPLGTPASKVAVDFDINGLSAAMSDCNTMLKTANLFSESDGWPYYDGAEYLYERTVTLPVNAWIKRIHVYKPADAGGSTTYILRVGNDDKTTIYGESVPAAQSAVHEINIEDMNIDVAAVANTRTIRLWCVADSTGQIDAGGFATVEYY